MQHRRLWSALLVVVLVLTVVSPAFAQDDGTVDLAPIDDLAGADLATTIPDRYIVVFKDGTDPAAVDTALVEAELAATESLDAAGNRQTLNLHYRYESALIGFAASMPASSLETLKKNPNVAIIEPDQVITLSATQSPVTWGLDRIDQRNLPLSNSFTYNNTGAGVTAYIVDTGILYGHNEFGGRASFGYDAFGGNGSDCNGHGTHVAGTVGGSVYGVAKSVTLKAVRVLNCSGSGTNSGVIAGVNWVASHHSAGAPAVANMSLGGSVSSALDTAVNNAINDGVTLQLRLLPGPVRPRFVDHLGLVHQQHGHQHHQRHIHGDAARGGRGCAVPAQQHQRFTGHGAQRHRQQRDHRQGHQPRQQLAQPAAVHRLLAVGDWRVIVRRWVIPLRQQPLNENSPWRSRQGLFSFRGKLSAAG